MKQKWVCCLLVLCAAFIFLSTGSVLAAGVSMTLDGNAIAFPDQQPFIDSDTGRTMIPMRAVAENMRTEVAWDGKDTATITQNGSTIIMKIGSKTPVVNGVKKYLDAPAVLCNGYTMVPVRFISEAMGCNVVWDGNNNCVNITTTGAATPPVQTTPVTTPAVQTTQDGLLPDEDKIQEELTQEDIQRLRSYTVVSPKVQEDLNKIPPDKAAQFTREFDTFSQNRKASILNGLTIWNDISSFDYANFASQAFADNYGAKYYSVGVNNADNESIVKQYIAESIANKLKIKTYLLSSENLIYQASPNYTAIRIKYIFYQSSGSKIVEEGSSLGRWYWRDVEMLFVVPLGAREGNTTGVIYSGFTNLSDPQPYFKK